MILVNLITTFLNIELSEEYKFTDIRIFLMITLFWFNTNLNKNYNTKNHYKVSSFPAQLTEKQDHGSKAWPAYSRLLVVVVRCRWYLSLINDYNC